MRKARITYGGYAELCRVADACIPKPLYLKAPGRIYVPASLMFYWYDGGVRRSYRISQAGLGWQLQDQETLCMGKVWMRPKNHANSRFQPWLTSQPCTQGSRPA